MLRLHRQARLRVADPLDPRFADAVSLLRKGLAEVGLQVVVVHAGRAADVEMVLDPGLKDERHHLHITSKQVQLRAGDGRGLIWATQTLLQLASAAPRRGIVELPIVQIDDAPRFAYRGQMLDVVRHFMPVSMIKRHLDLMSRYKLNVFRWHLTDDQGWRLQIHRYPNLTDLGAWRTEPNGERHGGFYTQAEVRDVVAYARERGIEVIPEIEMPGHASAAIAAYPWLGCTGKQIAIPNSWGVFRDVFCVAKPEVREFLRNVLDEVVPLFPSRYIHIGGDEAPRHRWIDDASTQALMREQGLKNEGEVQTWFVHQMQRHLASRQRTLIGWDEILEGELDKGAIVEVWRGDEVGLKALQHGSQVIHAGSFYLDSPPDQLTLEKVYRSAAIPVSWQAFAEQVWGVEAPLWTEHIDHQSAWGMLYPRLLAFSEVAWGSSERSDYAGFLQRLPAQLAWFDHNGISHGPADRRMVTYTVRRDGQHWRVDAIRGFDDIRLHYTLDGSRPTAASPAFADSYNWDQHGVLRVLPFRNGRSLGGERRFEGLRHLALDADIAFSRPPAEKYAGRLNDGLLGGLRYDDGAWAGWQGDPLTITLDVRRVQPIGGIAAHFLQQTVSWIVLPREVRYSVSIDGLAWKPLHRETLLVDPYDDQRKVVDVAWRNAEAVQARYIRVEVEGYGPLPQQHAGAGRPAWFFLDEIRVTP